MLLKWKIRCLPPSDRPDKDLQIFDSSQLSLLGALSGQSLLKHLLTEGDRVVVSWTCPLEDQGGYALAANYGELARPAHLACVCLIEFSLLAIASLITRIVLQPLEESARLYFSRAVNRAKPNLQPFYILSNMARLSVLFLLGTLVFVPPVGSIFVPLILPPQYQSTSAPQTLVAYTMIYLPVMSLNGILEGFFAATTDAKGVASQSGVLAGCSLAFGATLLLFRYVHLKLDHVPFIKTWTSTETSLVYANTVQMFCRIFFSGRHALKLGRETSQRLSTKMSWSIMPGTLSLGAALLGLVVTRHIATPVVGIASILSHVAIIGACGLVYLIAM